ncbi:MAG: YggS family pyridoxal phosphate-dependent enzyme [Betaproteobacteria bacterium]|nr:YggS family pyridoxal phosphate-dependent enzyme [Betaproteobacteria bacterium]
MDQYAYIGTNLKAVYARVISAALTAGRNPQDVRIIAVSKTFPGPALQAAFDYGQRAFGESYLQEALEKIPTLRGEPEWHYIGPLQSNKTRAVAASFDWVHSVDRLKIAERLSNQRPPDLAPLQICLQVNVSGEATKSGVAPADALALARELATLPRLRLRGLMAIPEAVADLAIQRAQFARVRQLCEEMGREGIALDTLSMGMSDDLEAAIMEGATLVRVGRAIFGEREP